MSDFIVAFVGTLAFVGIFAYNWLHSKSWLDPSVAISAIWSLTFLFLTVAGGQLYGVSWEALFIFVLGLAMFSLGAHIGKSLPMRVGRPAVYGYRSDHVILWVFLMTLVLGLPFYISYVRQFSSASLLSPAFFLEVRQAMMYQSSESARAPLICNLVPLSSIAAMLAFGLTESGRRWRLVVTLIVILTVFYNLLTAAKEGG